MRMTRAPALAPMFGVSCLHMWSYSYTYQTSRVIRYATMSILPQLNRTLSSTHVYRSSCAVSGCLLSEKLQLNRCICICIIIYHHLHHHLQLNSFSLLIQKRTSNSPNFCFTLSVYRLCYVTCNILVCMNVLQYIHIWFWSSSPYIARQQAWLLIDLVQGLRHRGGGGGTCPTQYFKFLTICLWVLHGKNWLQTAFAPPPNHWIVTEPFTWWSGIGDFTWLYLALSD